MGIVHMTRDCLPPNNFIFGFSTTRLWPGALCNSFVFITKTGRRTNVLKTAQAVLSMASRSSFRLLRTAPMRSFRLQPLQITRSFATPTQGEPLEPPPPPPYLSTLKSDLKTAMKAKDAPRLAVLRAVISHHNNVAKTKQAMKSDVDLVRYIIRVRNTAEESMAEAEKAGRSDLIEKAKQEADLLEEYEAKSGVEVISEQQMHEIVAAQVAKSKETADGKKSLLNDVLGEVKKQVQGKLCDNRLLVPIAQQQIKDLDKA